MHHQQDFGIDYFATRHGKSTCDGIGAVVKCQARRASLQRVSSQHITSPRELYKFASENLKAIISVWYGVDDVKVCQEQQEKRYSKAPSVPGSRIHHCYERDGNVFLARRTSDGEVSMRITYSGITPRLFTLPDL